MNPNIYEEAVTPPLTQEQELAKAQAEEVAKVKKHQRIQKINDWMNNPFSRELLEEVSRKIGALTVETCQLAAGGHPSNELIRAKNVEQFALIKLNNYLTGQIDTL